jgi:hypothetical protein
MAADRTRRRRLAPLADSRGTRSHHWRVAADRGALSGLITKMTERVPERKRFTHVHSDRGAPVGGSPRMRVRIVAVEILFTAQSPDVHLRRRRTVAHVWFRTRWLMYMSSRGPEWS